MTKADWFAIKIVTFNSIAFALTISSVTFLDARLTTHVAFGARHYPHGYAISLLGGSIIAVATSLVFIKASSWKAKALFPAMILAVAGVAILPFFRPEFPHSGIASWISLFAFVSLLACYIHFLPSPPDWFVSKDISTATKSDRMKEHAIFWRTIAICIAIGYAIIIGPWVNLTWNQPSRIVRNSAEAFLLSEFGIAGMLVISLYVLLGVIYESFRKAHDAADLVLHHGQLRDDRHEDSATRGAENNMRTYYSPPAITVGERLTGASTPAFARNQVFISYSRKDRDWLDRLQIMLKPLVRSSTITVWSETVIQPGNRWKEELRKALASAKVAVLLVSDHFLASDFIAQEELTPLLAAAEQEGVEILWIYLRPCLWKSSPIAAYQAAHATDHALIELPESAQQRVLLAVAEEIQKAAS